MRTILIAIATGPLFVLTTPNAGAAVVTNAGVSLQANQIWNGTAYVPTYQIGVAQSQGGTALDTSTWFTVTTRTVNGSTSYGMYAVTYTLDEGADWFIAGQNASFIPGTAASQFTPLIVGGTFYTPVSIPNGSFYLAYNTGLLPAPTRGEAFGWVRLQNTDGTLTLLSSAAAYGEPGIVIGSTTIVPEPAIMTAMLGATAVLLCRQRRRA